MALYFASDVHLGLSYRGDDPHRRERMFVSWLSEIEADCDGLYLVGDIFDFWFEWKRAIPKGFSRVIGKLAQMSDSGIPIHLFAGNHDLWFGDYLVHEAGVTIHHTSLETTQQGVRLFIAHGDNVGRRDDFIGRALGRIFRSHTARWLFSRLMHPDAALRFGLWWSSSNRHARNGVSHCFAGENEYLVRFARAYQAEVDIFIFGHLHTPIIYPLNQQSRLVVLGEWIENPTYARMESGKIELCQFCR